MSRLDVDYRLSLNYSSKYVAYWNINKDFGRITFYLPNIWDITTDHSLFIDGFKEIDKGNRWSEALRTLIEVRKIQMDKNCWEELD